VTVNGQLVKEEDHAQIEDALVRQMLIQTGGLQQAIFMVSIKDSFVCRRHTQTHSFLILWKVAVHEGKMGRNICAQNNDWLRVCVACVASALDLPFE